MDNINDITTKKELAYWMRMAYNYIEQSKTDTKIAEKVISLIQWYEVDSKWFIN